MSTFVSYTHLSPTTSSFITSLNVIFVPKTVSETLSHHGSCQAMIEEMDVVDTNDTWNLVDLPMERCLQVANEYSQ